MSRDKLRLDITKHLFSVGRFELVPEHLLDGRHSEVFENLSRKVVCGDDSGAVASGFNCNLKFLFFIFFDKIFFLAKSLNKSSLVNLLCGYNIMSKLYSTR